jgi:hypothetical protein
VSDDEADLWPVLPSEIVEDTLSDLDVSPTLFSVVVALTVAILRTPGLREATGWRTIRIGGRSSSRTGMASRSTGSTGPATR